MADRSSSRSSSWPWKKLKNSSKSSAATSSDQHHDKDEHIRASSNGDQLAMALSSATSSLAQELAAARDEIAVKEASVKQHQKVAEDAIAGWEKAEAEARAYKQQAEAWKQERGVLEDRVAHLDAALKECMKQVRHVKEESAAKMEEAMAMKSREAENLKAEMEERQAKLSERLMECQAQNNAMVKSLQERGRKISEASEARVKAETEAKLLEVKIGSYEKEMSSLKYEVHVSVKELEIRNEEVEFVKKAADAAHRQHLENVKKMANLEADVNRLRNLLKKKLPGPAAIAQMKKEVEALRLAENNNNNNNNNNAMMMTDPKQRRNPSSSIRSSYLINHTTNGPNASSHSPRSFAANSSSSMMYLSSSPGGQNGNGEYHDRDLEMLRDRMLWMEEENNLLKETLSKRNEELQAARLLSAKMAGKLSLAEDQLETLGLINGNEVQKIPDNVLHLSDVPVTTSENPHHGFGDSSNGRDDDDDGDGDGDGYGDGDGHGHGHAQEVSSAESWASALMSELAHFKKDKSIPDIANHRTSCTVETTSDETPHSKVLTDRLNISSNPNSESERCGQIGANPTPIAVNDPQSHHESESLNTTILENHSASCNGDALVGGEKQSILRSIHGDTAAYISLLNTLCQDLGRKLGAIEEHLKPSVAMAESQIPSSDDAVSVHINNDDDAVSRSMNQEEAAEEEDSDEATDNCNHNSNGDMGGSNSDALLQAMVDDAHKKFAELEKEIYALAGIDINSHSHSHSHSDGEKMISKESDIIELNGIIHELRADLDKAKADVACHVDTRAQVERDLEAARAEVAAARADVDSLKADVASREEAAKREIEEARAELASAEAEAAKLRVDVATLSAELAEQKKAYDDVAARVEELEQKLAAMQSFDDSNGSNGEDPDSRKERELVAAKEKLGECQRTILALGKQLTALSSPPGCHSPGGSFDTATSSMDSVSLLAHPYSNQPHHNNAYTNMEDSNPPSAAARYQHQHQHHHMNRRQGQGAPLTPSRISSASWSHNGNTARGGALYDVDEPGPPPRGGFPRYAVSGPQGTPPPHFLDHPHHQHQHSYEQQQQQQQQHAMRMSGQLYMGPPPQFYTNSNRYNGAGWAAPPGDGPLDDMEMDGHPLALTLYHSPHQQTSSVMSPAKSPARYYDQMNGTGRNVSADMAFHPTNTTTTTSTSTKEPSSSGSGLSRLFKSKKKH